MTELRNIVPLFEAVITRDRSAPPVHWLHTRLCTLLLRSGAGGQNRRNIEPRPLYLFILSHWIEG